MIIKLLFQQQWLFFTFVLKCCFDTLTIFHIYPWHTCLHNDIMLGIHNVLKNSNNFHVINIWWLKGWFYFILSNFPSNNQQIEHHQIFCIAFVDIFDITTCGEISTNVKKFKLIPENWWNNCFSEFNRFHLKVRRDLMTQSLALYCTPIHTLISLLKLCQI